MQIMSIGPFVAPSRTVIRCLKGKKDDARFVENEGCVSVRRWALGWLMSVRWERA
jgi:hypothetical protein